MNIERERDALRALVDELPEGELKVARRYLEYLKDVNPSSDKETEEE